MRRSSLLALLLVAAPLAMGGAQAAPAPQPPPQIFTTAQGEAKVTPDRATVQVGVQTRASTAAAAAAENARKQRAIIDAVKATGIPAAQISTTGYSVQPEMAWDKTAQVSRITGYQVVNTVRVEVWALDRVGAVLDAALAKGANQVNSLDFWMSNPDSARREALAMAVAKARGDAEVMARAAGGSLGSLIELTSSEYSPPPVFRREMAMKAQMADAAQAPTPIEVGQETVRASVSVRWQFVPRS
ncbi:MAG: hypothetical protein JWO05_1811 [Gemmatimonadetes bacterium]|nr:hypothetical protein [Gemmatimonadota bacterium]